MSIQLQTIMKAAVPVLIIVTILLVGLGLWQSWVQWFFLCEVQWFAGLFLLALPVLALTTERSLVLGAYEIAVDDFMSAFSVALAIGLCAVSIIWTAQLEFNLAGDRLQQPLPSPAWPSRIGAVLLIAGVLLNLVVTHIVSSPSGSRFSWRAVDTGLLSGLLFSIVLFVVGQWLITFLPGHLSLANLPQPLAGLITTIRNWLQTLPRQFTDGYIGNDAVGHFAAGLGFLVSALIYIGLGNRTLPPLCCLALLAIACVWFLSGFAFFLQVFRVPAILPAAVWMFLASSNKNADHFYRVVSANSPAPPGAKEFIGRYDPKAPMLVVAAAGGGIQAAAWTTRVLAGIQDACEQKVPGRFANSISLMSGVSGGSVGIMFYLGTRFQAKPDPKIASDASRASSLSQVTKALAYSDLRRAFLPFFPLDIYGDRGQALQDAWMENATTIGPADYSNALKQATLRTWAAKSSERGLPAVILNSTIVEQGKRMAFSTIPVNEASDPDSFVEFSTIYPGYDLPISTAARLSSAFTFVSPASRPEAPGLRQQDGSEHLHLVDGGYLDNSGISGLVEWLRQTFDLSSDTAGQTLPKKIVLIEISAFPNVKQGYLKGQRGTFFQLWAPLLTLFTVRSTGHEAAAQRELALFKLACKYRGIEFDWIKFQYEGFDAANPTAAPETPPLSWHLTQAQQQAIDDNWTTIENRANQVVSFLETGTMPDSQSENAN